MSECVVRMEMPKGCWDCPCVNGEYGYCQADKDERQIEDPNERPSWCPIIAASPWHRVEEELPPDGTIGRYLAYVFTNDAHWELHIVAWFRNKWLFTCGRVHYWMPIEPPKEDA